MGERERRREENESVYLERERKGANIYAKFIYVSFYLSIKHGKRPIFK
jgi:hypothetical protein